MGGLLFARQLPQLRQAARQLLASQSTP
ncbi:MAG: hypothetical protein SLRJCFUN_002051 [Candidatus Fervidibacter sp.]